MFYSLGEFGCKDSLMLQNETKSRICPFVYELLNAETLCDFNQRTEVLMKVLPILFLQGTWALSLKHLKLQKLHGN